MRKLIIGVMAGMLLPLSPAFAAEPTQAELDAVEAATESATTAEEIAAAIEGMLAAAETDAQKQAILAAAMSIFSGDTAKLAAVGTAARNQSVPTNVVTAAAKDAGVNPSTVVSSSPNGTPGSNGNALSAPSVGSSSGGGTPVSPNS